MKLPDWRFERESEKASLYLSETPVPAGEDTFADCEALGLYDGEAGFEPHSIDRFGEDQDGREMFQRYMSGYCARDRLSALPGEPLPRLLLETAEAIPPRGSGGGSPEGGE